MTVVVGSTLAAWKMNDPGCWGSWLANAEAIRDSHDSVDFLAVLELDARGREPFTPLLDRLADLGGHVWTFHLDDGAEQITTHNRLARICTGRNLIAHYAQDTGAAWVLYADADTAIPGDALPKLLAVDWPVVGGRVPTYCLTGPRVKTQPSWHSADCRWHQPDSGPAGDGLSYWVSDHGTCDCGAEDWNVTEHMNTAGFLLVRRDVFTRLRWRIDADRGLTDDPCFHEDATALGYPTRVREDCVAAHYPPAIGPVEQRAHDLTVYR